MAVEAFVEIFSGVIRAGEGCDSFGKPFEFAAAFVANGGVAEIKALAASDDKRVTSAHAKAAFRALKALGLKVVWNHFHEKTGKMKKNRAVRKRNRPNASTALPRSRSAVHRKPRLKRAA